MLQRLHVQNGLLALLVLLLVSCSQRVAFQNSTVVPGAEGKVKMGKDNNGNQTVNVSVVNLAQPDLLPNPQKIYVVWADTPDGTKNLGQLRTSKGLIGNSYKGDLTAIVQSKPRRVFITAEQDGSTTFPGNYVVMTTDNF
jgi:hypothetical protein